MALLFCVAVAAGGGAVFAVRSHANPFEITAAVNAGASPNGDTSSLASVSEPVCSQ
jgi:hypothetical protein